MNGGFSIAMLYSFPEEFSSELKSLRTGFFSPGGESSMHGPFSAHISFVVCLRCSYFRDIWNVPLLE